jgi:hypothetical protein
VHRFEPTPVPYSRSKRNVDQASELGILVEAQERALGRITTHNCARSGRLTLRAVTDGLDIEAFAGPQCACAKTITAISPPDRCAALSVWGHTKRASDSPLQPNGRAGDNRCSARYCTHHGRRLRHLLADKGLRPRLNPRLAAPGAHRPHHPVRPDRPPRSQRLTGWTTTRLQPRLLSAPQHHRTRLQTAQTLAWDRHPLRVRST